MKYAYLNPLARKASYVVFCDRLLCHMVGRPVNRFTPWHLPAAENGTMHTPGKLQFPDVSDAPTAPYRKVARVESTITRVTNVRCANTGVQQN